MRLGTDLGIWVLFGSGVSIHFFQYVFLWKQYPCAYAYACTLVKCTHMCTYIDRYVQYWCGAVCNGYNTGMIHVWNCRSTRNSEWIVNVRATNIICGEVKCSMSSKPTEAVLIKWVGNNTPRFDERIFCQDVQSIVRVHCRAISVLSLAGLKPGDAVIVQHVGKHNKPGWHLCKAVVMDNSEVANVQTSSATSTEPEFKQQGGTKNPRNKGVLYGWCCWYISV